MKYFLTICLSFAIGVIYSQKEQSPNVVFILVDDLGAGDIEPYGQQIIKTPNLNALASEGMKFTQFYAGAPVCAPSRASVITGQTTGETHIRGNKEVSEPIDGQAPILSSSPSIGKVFKMAGYNAGIFGKWGLGTVDSDGNPLLHGFDTFFGYNSQFRAHRQYPAFLWRDNQKVEIPENGYYKHQNVYANDLIHHEALQYIQNQTKNTPFFAYLTYTLPHAELAVPKDSVFESYRYLPEKPYKGRDYDQITEGFPNFWGYKSQPYAHATHAAMVTRLDSYLGDIRATLKKKGIEDDTIIIFASDNGAHREGGADPEFFNSSAGLRGFKRDVYEGGIRTPFIVYWKGKIKAGSINHHVGAFWDLFPTFAEIAGVKHKLTENQVSFLPTLLGKKQKKHKYLYWEFHEMGGRQAVRYKHWKGVRLNASKSKNAPIELYDLSKDPAETTDVAKKHPKIVKKIAKIMEKAHTKSDLFPFEWEK